MMISRHYEIIYEFIGEMIYAYIEPPYDATNTLLRVNTMYALMRDA